MNRQADALHRLGRRLSQLREKRQLSIDALAGLAGLDAGLVARIEAGEIDLQLTVLMMLAQALGVTPDQLVTDE